MRIHVTGNAGAGKTTLCRNLAAQYQLPVYHLDKIVWAANWQKPEPQQVTAALHALGAKPTWVIDGVSPIIREQADIILLLDTPTWMCLYRCVKRCFKYGWATRPELPENCPEIKVLFRAIHLVWRFSRGYRRQLLDEARDSRRYRVCRSPQQAMQAIEQFVAGGQS